MLLSHLFSFICVMTSVDAYNNVISTGMSSSDALNVLRDAEQCPPCFNCLLPAFSCKQFGQCNPSNGQCTCPAGFGGQDCAEPLCDALADGEHRTPRQGDTCNCSAGWTGINCNVCQSDAACNALMPDASVNGTCYSGGAVVRENHQICDVTNRKIVDILQGRKPQVTFTCRASDRSCKFQFWVAEMESFFCGLSNCKFSQDLEDNKLKTSYDCEKVECRCMPGRMLCGEDGSIDISDFLSEEIKGPGSITCPSGDLQNCKFHEPAMDQLISDVFGDSAISLNCQSGECLHSSEVPGYQQPTKEANVRLIVSTIIGTFVALSLAGGIFWLALHSRRHTAHPILDDDELSNKHAVQRLPVSLCFRDIAYDIGARNILHQIHGVVQPGQVLAIMGASGAGKTSLLDVLARKRKVGSVSGKVLINGQCVTDENFAEFAGFVDQEDALLPTLTVYETIFFSALLRLPRAMPKDAKIARVIQVMSDLRISHLRDAMIGENGARGISGGEKRRVSIACEMVTSPSILFLDEPTSGLDAYNAYNVVQCLKEMASLTRRTIVLTIHQPRSNIVTLFDQLILLSNGRLAYAGSVTECVNYLESIDCACPKGFNVTDHFIDLISPREAELGQLQNVLPVDEPHTNYTHDEQQSLIRSQVESDDEEVEGPSRGAMPTHKGPRETVRNQSHDFIRLFQQSSVHASLIARLNNESRASLPNADSVTPDSRHALRIHPVAQFNLLARRTFKNLYRNPMLLIAHYAMSTLLALLSGYLFFNISNDLSGFQNRLGLFFFILALFGFSTLTTLNLFAQERIVFMRERANGYYSSWTYFLAKVIFDMIPLRVLPPVLLGIIVYPMVGLVPELASFLRFITVLVLFNLAAAAVCLFLGIIIKNPSIANLFGSLFMLFSLLFAGLLLNHDKIPTGLQWLQKLSIFHYAYEALLVNEVTYLTLTEKKYGLSIDVPGATILSTFGFDAQAMNRDIVQLTGYFLFFLAAAFLAMHYLLVETR